MTTGVDDPDQELDEKAREEAEEGAESLWRSDTLEHLARLGIIARTVLYVLLTYLTVQVALQGNSARGGQQANAHGALSEVSKTPFGKALVVAAAVGFAAFAVARFLSAYADRDTGFWRRLSSAGSGLFYVGMAVATASYALGHTSTGSEQSHQHATARFLSLPAGREIVAAIGVVVVAVSLWQMRVAVSKDYDDGWCVDEMPSWLRRSMPAVAITGLVGRAAVFVPVGALLVAAAVTFDPKEAKGLDALLLTLAGSRLGLAVLALIGLGFAMFCVYSAVESRYRDIQSGA